MQVLGPLGLLETKFRRFDGELALKRGCARSRAMPACSAPPTRAATWCSRAPTAARWRGSPRAGGGVKMLWQHDPTQPIGVWDEVREDARGLFVRGRLLLEVRAAREAHVLLQAGAIDGLSIGYRTLRAREGGAGSGCCTRSSSGRCRSSPSRCFPRRGCGQPPAGKRSRRTRTTPIRPAGRGRPGAEPGGDLPRGPGTAGVRHAGVTHRGRKTDAEA